MACALALALVCCPILTAAASDAQAGLTSFSDGNFAYIALDPTRWGTSPDFKLELSEFQGEPAVKIAAAGARMPYIGISASSLLSADDLAKVERIVLQLGIESRDERFWPMTGNIYSYTGVDLAENSTKFGVQTPESNPKLVYSKLAEPFVAGAHNYVILQPSQDDGTAYVGKSDLYILGVGFMDADGNYLPTISGAGADFPDGYGVVEADVATYEYDLVSGPLADGWNNFGSGAVSLDIWQSALALVVEYAPREDGSAPLESNPGGSKFVIQVIGGPAEQGWLEVLLDDPLVESESGKLTLTLFDFDQVTEVQNVGIGCWDGADTITSVYLIVSSN